MSRIGWVDFSPDDRNKVKSVLALLAEPGTLDELGIGQVRDAFADLLFPGISTIQTRAKYFITVPRILRDYMHLRPAERRNEKSLDKYLLNRENLVAQVLSRVHQEDELGIIGRTRVESGGVDRRPSVIYWNGLRTFGLVRTTLSLADFCHQLDANELHGDLTVTEHEEDSDDRLREGPGRLVRLPSVEQDWFKDDKLHLKLTRAEAAFLKGKIEEAGEISDAVFPQLFRHNLLDKILRSDDAANINSVQGFDLLVEQLCRQPKVDKQCRKRLQQAREFSMAMEGPHIRYNLILAKRNDYEHRVKEYQSAFEEWLEQVHSTKLLTSGCEDNWLNTASVDGRRNIKLSAQAFIRDCVGLVRNNNVTGLDQRVERQARFNKKERTLLNRKLTHDGWQGIRRLDYRWGTARTILRDIQDGLNAEA